MLLLTSILHAGLQKVTTSPAGKASRHLSGCGSQPEPLHHPFSSFASSSSKQVHTSHVQHRPSTAEAGGPSSSNQLHASAMQQPSNGSQAVPSFHANARSPSPAVSQDETGAAARLNNLLRADVKAGAAYTAAQHWSEVLRPSPPTLPLKAAAQHSPGTALRSPSVPHDSIPKADAVPGGATIVRSGCKERSAKRRVSSHFGATAKRQRSNEASCYPDRPNPYGVLGGLVNQLQIRRSASGASLFSSSEADDIGVELEADSPPEEHINQKAVPSPDLYDDISDTEPEMPSDPIAGLEHIQPFASIANLAVENIRSSSLQKFATSRCEAHSDVLQPFAAPRRSGSASAQPKSTQARVTPLLQQYAFNMTSESHRK